MSVSQILLALAGNVAMLPAHIDQLIAKGSPAVSRELAQVQRLTPAQIETLIASGDRDVLLALIGSGQLAVERIPCADPWMVLAGIARVDAPGDWLDLLASCPTLEVRQALAVHAAERTDIAYALADDAVCSVAACAAQVWEIPEELALRLADRTEACVRLALASNRHTPARILAELIAHSGSPPLNPCLHGPDNTVALRDVRLAAAANPTTPVTAVEPLAMDLDAHVALALAGRPDLAEETYARLVVLGVPEVTGRVAINWAAPAGLLRRLYESEAGRWRGAVLANPRTPLDLLVRHSRDGGSPNTDNHPDLDGLRVLAADVDPRVRLVAAASHRIPEDLRALLSVDPDFEVALRAVCHASASPEQVRVTAARHGPATFPRLAAHPCCPPDVLLTIATHPQAPAEAVMDVAWNEASPPAALAACLRYPANAVYVAGNPSTPPDMLVELASHPDPEVVLEVARNPSLPVSACDRILEFAAAQYGRTSG
ncbi:hypothetical protein HDA40_000788 [Hamadaea flava]|uniref:Leucine rich repeat (LRR) protein n=1 Tax=Hamadaea flava TaxID=1742688 RepID=A0ABV8LRY2_9ACTN|nr:hypothetical protein [Hamadaea flava]MCP2322281.1 hypothetical protein [Hamadaea flava]